MTKKEKKIIKKKLLIATDSFLPRWDGVARFLDEVIPHLAQEFDITVVCTDYGKHQAYPAKIIKLALSKLEIAHYIPADVDKKSLQNLVKKSDIIFTQTIGPIGFYTLRYASKYKKKTAAFIHSIEWNLFSESLAFGQKIAANVFSRLIPHIYKKPSTLICPSQEIVRILKSRKVGEKYDIVHLGIDTKRFTPGPSTKSKLKIEDYTVIGYLGRTGREKDLDTLYEVFRELHEHNKKIHLLIVGGKVDWKDMRGITNIESVDDPWTYLHMMDIYVLPSLTETTSLTTLEAMGCGLPVLVTPVGHINVYIKDRKNGVLFPPKDKEYLSAELKELIVNKDLRERLGKAARKTVEDMTWEKTGSELVKVLNSL